MYGYAGAKQNVDSDTAESDSCIVTLMEMATAAIVVELWNVESSRRPICNRPDEYSLLAPSANFRVIDDLLLL